MNLPAAPEKPRETATPGANTSRQDRRAFLQSSFPALFICGLGCPGMSRLAALDDSGIDAAQEKAQQVAGMTYEDIFNFTYRDYFIPVMKQLAEDVGTDVLLGQIRSAADKVVREFGSTAAANLPANHLSALVESLKNPSDIFKNAQSFEIVEESETAFEVKFTECLWARVFRESNAADLGYAIICHPDAAYAEGFNPRIRMSRSKTLMEGDEYCDHRWYLAD